MLSTTFFIHLLKFFSIINCNSREFQQGNPLNIQLLTLYLRDSEEL